MVLGKNPLTTKGTRCMFIKVILYFSHENRNVIVLFDCEVDKDLISQRFAKENSLEATPVGRIEIIVDGHYVIIYKFYNIIIKIKDSRNEVRVTQRTFYVIDM